MNKYLKTYIRNRNISKLNINYYELKYINLDDIFIEPDRWPKEEYDVYLKNIIQNPTFKSIKSYVLGDILDMSSDIRKTLEVLLNNDNFFNAFYSSKSIRSTILFSNKLEDDKELYYKTIDEIFGNKNYDLTLELFIENKVRITDLKGRDIFTKHFLERPIFIDQITSSDELNSIRYYMRNNKNLLFSFIKLFINHNQKPYFFDKEILVDFMLEFKNDNLISFLEMIKNSENFNKIANNDAKSYVEEQYELYIMLNRI
jgi:hypothetical protein